MLATDAGIGNRVNIAFQNSERNLWCVGWVLLSIQVCILKLVILLVCWQDANETDTPLKQSEQPFRSWPVLSWSLPYYFSPSGCLHSGKSTWWVVDFCCLAVAAIPEGLLTEYWHEGHTRFEVRRCRRESLVGHQGGLPRWPLGKS